MEDKGSDVLSTQRKINEKDAGEAKLEAGSMDALKNREEADPSQPLPPPSPAPPHIMAGASQAAEAEGPMTEALPLHPIKEPSFSPEPSAGTAQSDVCFTVRIPLKDGGCCDAREGAGQGAAERGEALDALLACAAEEARRCGNPLRRLRSVLTPGDDVRPLRLDEAGGDRYELFWSNLGLLRRYQDPLRRALSGRSVWSEDASDPADEDLRDFLTWHPRAEDEEEEVEEEEEAEGKWEVGGGKVEVEGRRGGGQSDADSCDDEEAVKEERALPERKMEFRGNSVSNIWHERRDTRRRQEIDQGLKNMRKRVHFFFKSLFKANRRFRKLE